MASASASKTETVDAQFPSKLRFLFDHYRYKIAYGGRGGSKSWGFARALLIQGAQTKLRILCTREVQNSIRDSVHKLLSDQIEILQLGSFYHITRDAITGANGTEFMFAGLSNLTAESIKSYEGVDRAWIEEGQKVRQRSLDILIPTIRKPDSEIWVSFNPELESDEVYQRFVVNTPENACVVEVNYGDNPWFPEVLEEERQEFKRQVAKGVRTKEEYENIWEGKPRQAVHGAIFAEQLNRARTQGRIGRVPYDPKKLVYTSWDIGKGDPTAIWFWQQLAGEVGFIDYFEDSGEDITYYLEALARKPYRYATCHMPHDSRHDRIGMPKTIEAVVRDNGFKVNVIPVRSLDDQINETRILLARARFDETNCRAGLNAIGHYHWGYNQVLDQLKPTPVHDWSSHGASALMAAAMSMKAEDKPQFKPIKYDSRGIV